MLQENHHVYFTAPSFAQHTTISPYTPQSERKSNKAEIYILEEVKTMLTKVGGDQQGY